MNIEEILKKYLSKNNGYISSGDFKKIGISKKLIPDLIQKEIIRKVTYGIYIDNNLIEDEYYLLQKRISNIVFSYNTACYLLELSDRSPYKLDVTTIRGKHINEDLSVHYVTKEKFEIGIKEIISPYGNPIKIYNAERCICDLIKNSNSVDLEVYNKIIKNYFNSKNKDLITLEKYANQLNVSKKLKSIMEVLL